MADGFEIGKMLLTEWARRNTAEGRMEALALSAMADDRITECASHLDREEERWTAKQKELEHDNVAPGSPVYESAKAHHDRMVRLREGSLRHVERLTS